MIGAKKVFENPGLYNKWSDFYLKFWMMIRQILKFLNRKIRNGIKISEGKLHKVDIKKDDLNTSKWKMHWRKPIQVYVTGLALF